MTSPFDDGRGPGDRRPGDAGGPDDGHHPGDPARWGADPAGHPPPTGAPRHPAPPPAGPRHAGPPPPPAGPRHGGPQPPPWPRHDGPPREDVRPQHGSGPASTWAGGPRSGGALGHQGRRADDASSSATLAPGDPGLTADGRDREQQLRRPAHRANPRAVPYWIIAYLIGWLWLIIPMWVVAIFAIPDDQGWKFPVAGALTVAMVLHSIVAPLLAYRIHRWEVTPSGVITRTGWLNREERVAPINRVQTVDSKRGALMQLFRLATVTVTTASSAGAVEIEAIDSALAYEVVAELTAKTAASEGDAT